MKSEDISAYATIAQAIILAIQSGLLIWTIYISVKNMEISRKQLYAAQRPWIFALPTISKAEITRKCVAINVVFVIQNSGGSFANNVSVIANAMAVKPNVTRPGDAVFSLHKSKAPTSGTISVPGQPSLQSFYLKLDRISIENAKTETHKGILVCVYGFVEYRSTIDNANHHTDFSYVLGEKNGDNIRAMVDVDGEIDPNRLKFMNVGSDTVAT